MVVMAAKWRGRCRVCGCVIPQGVQIEWTKETSARHVSPEACAEALANPLLPDPPLRGSQPQTPEDFERLKRLLLAQTWKVAKSMPSIPHAYTLRRLWVNDEDFIWAVEYIRRVGYEGRFVGRVFTYIDVAEHQYWSCDGDPRSTDPRTTVGLINRALLVRPAMGGRRVEGRLR